MPPAHWLVKSEPSTYAWDRLVDERRTFWDGVRNYEARNNLRAMKVGDLLLYYHSGESPEVVGVARVVREAYQDPTTDEDAWVAVDVEPLQRLDAPVSLAAIRGEPALAEMFLIKRGRISVVPVSPPEFARVLVLGATLLRPDAVPEKLPPRPAPERKKKKEAARKPATKPRKKKATAPANAKKKKTKKSQAAKKSPRARRGRGTARAR